MLQKSHSQPPGMVLKPVVNKGIFTISTGFLAGFLNHPTVSPRRKPWEFRADLSTLANSDVKEPIQTCRRWLTMCKILDIAPKTNIDPKLMMVGSDDSFSKRAPNFRGTFVYFFGVEIFSCFVCFKASSIVYSGWTGWTKTQLKAKRDLFDVANASGSCEICLVSSNKCSYACDL